MHLSAQVRQENFAQFLRPKVATPSKSWPKLSSVTACRRQSALNQLATAPPKHSLIKTHRVRAGYGDTSESQSLKSSSPTGLHRFSDAPADNRRRLFKCGRATGAISNASAADESPLRGRSPESAQPPIPIGGMVEQDFISIKIGKVPDKEQSSFFYQVSKVRSTTYSRCISHHAP